MLKLRPIVVDDNGMILGGNMRYRAALAIGLHSVPVLYASDLTPEKKNEFVVKDNVSAGRWDWDILSLHYSDKDVADWGVNTDYGKAFDAGLYGDGSTETPNPENYTRKVETPIYAPSEECPNLEDITDTRKYFSLLSEIDSTDGITEQERLFLRLAATRHIRLTYDLAADYYSHASEPMRLLMESSALVIIDYDKAIANGFVKLTTAIEAALADEVE